MNGTSITNGTAIPCKSPGQDGETGDGKTKVYKVYRRRWLMLALFCLCDLSNAFHWIEYSVIANIIVRYYGVDPFAVDWLSVVYMLTYIPLVIPVTYFMEKKGLRMGMLLAAFGTSLGSWIKVFSVSPDRFYVTFIGQAVVAVAHVFLFGTPARLAAEWFGPNQVSTASAIGVIVGEFGVAMGFLLPPILIRNHENIDDIGADLQVMFIGCSILPTVIFVVMFFAFQNSPPTPASAARAALNSNITTISSFKKSLKRLVTNKNYVLLLFSYSFAVGMMDNISTLLNQVMMVYFPNHEEDVGRMGVTSILSGFLGSSLLGIFLDKTHKFRMSSIFIYVLYIISLLIYTFLLSMKYLPLMYIIIIFFGFYSSSYYSFGYEYAAELTYPEPESASSGLLNAMNFLAGSVFINISAYILDTWGDFTMNLFCVSVLFAGLVFNCCIQEDLRRTRAHNNYALGENDSEMVMTVNGHTTTHIVLQEETPC